MSEKENQDFHAIIENAKYLAKNDPQSLSIIKVGMDMLKARCDLCKFESNFAQSS